MRRVCSAMDNTSLASERRIFSAPRLGQAALSPGWFRWHGSGQLQEWPIPAPRSTHGGLLVPDITGPYAPGTPCWVDLTVPDQQAALDFYRDVFGWQGEIGWPETGGYWGCTPN